MANEKINPYNALVRRLEMQLARQKNSVSETELQLEAAVNMRTVHEAAQVQGDLLKAGKSR